MIEALSIMLISYCLNAMADAIDHAKGARDLKTLWHCIKAVSYAIPFGYIIYLKFPLMKNIIIFTVILLPLLLIVWELTYRVCRFFDIQRFDK